ncbi:MAG: hypothetical protein ACK4LQ_14690 [Pararhodobacter sp.]
MPKNTDFFIIYLFLLTPPFPAVCASLAAHCDGGQKSGPALPGNAEQPFGCCVSEFVPIIADRQAKHSRW